METNYLARPGTFNSPHDAVTTSAPKQDSTKPRFREGPAAHAASRVDSAAGSTDVLDGTWSNSNGAQSDSLPSTALHPASPSLAKGKLYSTVKRLVALSRLTSHSGHKTEHENPDTLCEYCSPLDLGWGSFIVKDKSPGPSTTGSAVVPPSGKHQLGTLGQILERSLHCPLCRTIAQSLREQKNTAWARVLQDLETHAVEPWSALNSSLGALSLDAKCQLMWQIDGRRKTVDEHGEESEANVTRRLQIQWEDKAYDDAFIVLVYPDVNFGPRKQFLGRLLDSSEVSRIEQIRRWYRLCSEEHAENCGIDHANSERFEDLRHESYFGVIDVNAMRLTALPEGEMEYAALSYTWGPHAATLFQTTQRNVYQLQKPDGLNHVWDQLPKTIQDAIELVRELGIGYLWIDSLCILQGDAEVWGLNSNHMDTIYGYASLTICAADGDDANAGLVALHPNRSTHGSHATQYVGTIGRDTKLMVVYPSETYIGRSTWNKRAWTFQERVLSKRLLIFAEGRVYFLCRSSTMSEDIYEEAFPAGWWIELLHVPMQQYQKTSSHPFLVYKYSVPLYTCRVLTHQHDILAAFSGIGKEIGSRLNGELIFGLPNSYFDLALLWKSDSARERRYGRDGKLKFPSWSWCGWKGTRMAYAPAFTAGVDSDINGWLNTRTWITWYIRDGQGNLRLVWDSLLHRDDQGDIDRKWRSYSWWEINPDNCDPVDSKGFRTRDRYGRPLNPQMRTKERDIFHRTMPKYPYQVRMVPPGKWSTRPQGRIEERTEDQRFLQFWTWSAHFRLVPAVNDPLRESHKPQQVPFLIIGENALVGMISLNWKWLDRVTHESRHEFIAISEAKYMYDQEMPLLQDAEVARHVAEGWTAYNVLLLEYDDEIDTVARRAGLGKIWKADFKRGYLMPGQEESMVWKEIILG